MVPGSNPGWGGRKAIVEMGWNKNKWRVKKNQYKDLFLQIENVNKNNSNSNFHNQLLISIFDIHMSLQDIFLNIFITNDI